MNDHPVAAATGSDSSPRRASRSLGEGRTADATRAVLSQADARAIPGLGPVLFPRYP